MKEDFTVGVEICEINLPIKNSKGLRWEVLGTEEDDSRLDREGNWDNDNQEEIGVTQDFSGSITCFHSYDLTNFTRICEQTK